MVDTYSELILSWKLIAINLLNTTMAKYHNREGTVQYRDFVAA